MPAPNFANKLYFGDCLEWMGKWHEETVNLIYLDPPFNSNTNYNILFGQVQSKETQAQRRAFVDTWTWDEEAVKRFRRMSKQTGKNYRKAIDGLHTILGEVGMLAYLTYMTERLEECCRLLKPTGSIYLHCDDTSVHYLKIVMDAIFGGDCYLNDIIWRRSTSHNDAKKFGRIADHILFYSKSSDFYWAGHEIAEKRSREELRKAYPQGDGDDPDKWYRSDNLTGPGGGSPDSPSNQSWKGYEVYSRGRCWSAPKTGKYAEYIEKHFIPGYRNIEGIHDRLNELDKAGLIHHPRKGTGGWAGLKRYAAADQGNMPQSIILEPIGYTNFTRPNDAFNYPTRKPDKLLEKLILAACPKDGLVLDPFCGCGTTIAAAIETGRNYAGIDISTFAIETVCEKRFNSYNIKIEGIPSDMKGAKRLMKESPYNFETWAINRIPGLVPNVKQSDDGGIDGEGLIMEQFPQKSKAMLAQVKGGKFQLKELRDFAGVVLSKEAGMGIFITMDPVDTQAARKFCAELGKFQWGTLEYPRVMCWSIAEYFENNKKPPNLPPMYNPQTGEEMLPAEQMSFKHIKRRK